MPPAWRASLGCPRRPARHRVRRVGVRAVVNADAESIDELAAEPAANRTDDKSDDFNREQAARCRELAAAVTHPEHVRKAENGDDVADGVPKTDPFRTRASRDRKPIDQSEHGGEQSADDSS